MHPSNLEPMPRKAVLWASIMAIAVLAGFALALFVPPRVPAQVLASLFKIERKMEAHVSTLLILVDSDAEAANAAAHRPATKEREI